MTSSSRSWHAHAQEHPNQPPNPLPGLVEQLLDLLLDDVQTGNSAQLTVQSDAQPEPGATEAGAGISPYAWLGDPAGPGRLVTASASLTDGGTVTLAVRGDLLDDEPTQAQLRRFIRPMVACVALERQLSEQTGRARDAVAEIERSAIFDLATGIVMARHDCDPETARRLLAAWSVRTGHDLRTPTAARVLELLTADPP